MPSATPAPKLVRPAASGNRVRKSAIVLRQIAHNLRCRFAPAMGKTGPAEAAPAGLDAAERMYRDYVYYGGLTPEHLANRRILDAGSGHNSAVALRFLAAGAGAVVALDRFANGCDAAQAGAVYRALRERLSAPEQARFDAAVDLAGAPRFNPERLRVVTGWRPEEALRGLEPESFSIVVSHSRLAEIHSIDRTFRALDRLLERGGLMLHKIDLGDYGTFSRHGMHPLEFLTLPEIVYTMMSDRSGLPNRHRIDYYRAKMRELGYFAGLLVTAVAGEPGEIVPHRPAIEPGTDYPDESLALVRAIRPRLARRFRHLSDADLLVTGLFLVARKPE
jgi:SAM-dependent methyltransferase